MRPRLRSYFWKILFTIGGVSVGFMVIVLSTLGYYMVVPLGERATDDLASIIVHAAEQWEQLSSEARPTFAQRVLDKHGLVATEKRPPLPVSDSLLPYLHLLKHSLAQVYGREIPLLQSMDERGEEWFWVDVPLKEGMVRFGFPRSRIGVQPSMAFFVLLATGFGLTFLTAVLLTRRLTVPIERLYQAAQRIGRGEWPDPVPEEGPEELVVLAREFNRMSVQVRELIANRTTLLAGISHDLRTPLTQIQLALAMLPDDGGNPELMAGIHRDLEAVDRLISQALQVDRGLAHQEKEPTNVAEALLQIIAAVRRGNQVVEWRSDTDCVVTLNPLALQRCVSNLLENALRYGEGKPVRVECRCDEERLIIEILDRGPGIPAEQREAVFQPFFRLEKSRSSQTGGSGLGLAIVRQLTTSNGWRVELLPREGGGTRARLTIPLH